MASLAIVVFLCVFILAALAVFAARALMDRANPEAFAVETRSLEEEPESFSVNDESLLLREAEVSSISLWAWLLHKFNLVERLNRDLEEADLNWSAGRVSLTMLLCGTVAYAALGHFRWLPFWADLAFAALAALTPYFYITHKKQTRRAQLEEQFPDALESLARALRAGYAFGGAFETVAAQTPNPLGRELKKTFAEGALGMPWDQALDAFMRRLPSQEICIFVAAVQMQSKSGGNLSEVLEKLSENMREGAALRGEVNALSAQGRFAGYILTALPLAITAVLFVVNPSFLVVLIHDEIGKLMLGGAAVGLVAAHFIIRKLVEVQI